MMDPDERERIQAQELNKLEDQVRKLEEQASTVPVSEGFERPIWPQAVPEGPVSVADLKRFWMRSPTLLSQGALRPRGDGSYEIRWAGRLYRIAFDREAADRRTSGALLFTYGHPCFEAVLDQARANEDTFAAVRVRRTVALDGMVTYWCESRPVETLGKLLAYFEALQAPGHGMAFSGRCSEPGSPEH